MLWIQRSNFNASALDARTQCYSEMLILTSSSLEIVGLMQGSCHFVREDCMAPPPPKKKKNSQIYIAQRFDHNGLISSFLFCIITLNPLFRKNHFGSHLPGWGASCWFVGPGHYYWAAIPPPTKSYTSAAPAPKTRSPMGQKIDTTKISPLKE